MGSNPLYNQENLHMNIMYKRIIWRNSMVEAIEASHNKLILNNG